MKITFEDSNACITYKTDKDNGDININPKFIAKFGHIVAFITKNGEARAEPKDFVFDGKGVTAVMKIEIEMDNPLVCLKCTKFETPKCPLLYIFNNKAKIEFDTCSAFND